MISVPNHLQPLNGNRTIAHLMLHSGFGIRSFLMMILVVLFFSCGTSRKTPSYQPVVRPDPVPVSPPPIHVEEKEKKDSKTDDPVKVDFTLILPFDLKNNFIPAESETGTTGVDIKPASLQALNFYEGAVLAADSLAGQKRQVRLKAYDAPGDSAGIKRMFSLMNPRDAGIVIATFPPHLSHVAAEAASKSDIPLVLTQASDPRFLANNSQTVLAYTSTFTQCREMVKYLVRKHPGSKVFLIYRNLRREDDLSEAFRSEIKKSGQISEFIDWNVTEKGTQNLGKSLSTSKRNLLFVVSSDEAFVNPLLNQIESQDIGGVIIGGLPTWQNFESINFMSFKNLVITIFDNNYIDYNDHVRRIFRKQFIARYASDPMPSAFNGFELVYYLGLYHSGQKTDLEKLFRKAFSDRHDWFDFESVEKGGLENTKISVLKFADYEMKPAGRD
jgi:hypothetical protein